MQRMSAQEYLAWEREQPEKHEYHLGEVFEKEGCSVRHNFLSASILGELYEALRATSCFVLPSNQRISPKPGEHYVYPDGVVVCGGFQAEPEAFDVLTNPSVIVEVLSRGTEAHDRGAKWRVYQHMTSLMDYLLVSQEKVRVEHFERAEGGTWKYRAVEAGGTVTLANGATLSVDAVYEGAFELAAS